MSEVESNNKGNESNEGVSTSAPVVDGNQSREERTEERQHADDLKVCIVGWFRRFVISSFRRLKRLDLRQIIELVGLLGVFLTLRILNGTLMATRDAAKAAKTSADISTKALEFGEGASLALTVLGPQCLKVGYNTFRVQVDNLGRLDATHVTPINLGVIPGEFTGCASGSIDPRCVKSDLISPFETPYFCPTCYEDSRRWLVVHPVELAKRTGERLIYNRRTRVLTTEDLNQIEFTPRDEDGRMLVIAFAAFRYWDGFRCRLVSSCGQYTPRMRRDRTDDNSGTVCGETLIPLSSCEYPVIIPEEQKPPKPEDCEQPGPQPTRTPRSLRDRLWFTFAERIPSVAPTYNPYEPIPKPVPTPEH